eukprot:311727_1
MNFEAIPRRITIEICCIKTQHKPPWNKTTTGIVIEYGASSRQSSIEKAHQMLLSEIDVSSKEQVIEAHTCDVTKQNELEALFDCASQTFTNGRIDIVINNFGISYCDRDYLWNVPSDDIRRIVSVNLGSMICANQMAIQHYIASKHSHALHIFNQSGAGTNGMTTPKFLAYGVSKGGFKNLMNSLNKELKQAKLNDQIFVHTLSPGMVWTHLMARKKSVDANEAVYDNPKQYWILNALLDTCHNVCHWLVPRIRGIATKRKPKGGYFPQYLTKSAAFANILRASLFGYNKGRFIDAKGMAAQPVE